jgi:hypothetical protein
MTKHLGGRASSNSRKHPAAEVRALHIGGLLLVAKSLSEKPIS